MHRGRKQETRESLLHREVAGAPSHVVTSISITSGKPPGYDGPVSFSTSTPNEHVYNISSTAQQQQQQQLQQHGVSESSSSSPYHQQQQSMPPPMPPLQRRPQQQQQSVVVLPPQGANTNRQPVRGQIILSSKQLLLGGVTTTPAAQQPQATPSASNIVIRPTTADRAQLVLSSLPRSNTATTATSGAQIDGNSGSAVFEIAGSSANVSQPVVVSATISSSPSIGDNNVNTLLNVGSMPEMEPMEQEDADDSDNALEIGDDTGDSLPMILGKEDDNVPLSSLTWEAYELCSDWNKSLKGDHGILAALDLSLPLPMCTVDISSPTKHRDILDIFADVNLDLPPYNMIDNRMEGAEDRNIPFSNSSLGFPDSMSNNTTDASSSASLPDLSMSSAGNEFDRSNMLMTPQELERMPDQGMEFEQSVGPKNPPHFDNQPPFIISSKGSDLTTITVMTSNGQKVFKVNTAQLCKAASNMQPVIINADDKDQHSTLVMLPVSKIKLVSDNEDGGDMEGTRPKFKCLYCQKRFARSYKLRVHEMMKHTGGKPFPCQHPGCNWSFTDGYRLRRHQICHQKVRSFTCAVCTKSFSTIYNLRTHEHSIHGPDNLKWECTVDGCDARYSVESKLHKHMYTNHKQVALAFKCPEDNCIASFYSRVGLDRHLRSHAKKKELKCPIEGCNMEFTHASRLNAHIKTHTGERPFQCDYPGCFATFATKTRLSRHRLSHSEVRQHICSVCHKSFHRMDHLKTHEFTHRQQKPFQCTEPGCTHRCTSMSQLRMHMRRHQVKKDRVMLICPTKSCESMFATKSMLLRHINAHHPEIVAAQYLQELPEHHLTLSTDGADADTAAVAIAAAAAEVGVTAAAEVGVAAALSNVQPWETLMVQPATVEEPPGNVITTDVGGKQISLLIPNLAPPTTSTIKELVVKTAKVKDVPKKIGKGSARTDSTVNDELCLKARQRQELQRKIAMDQPMLTVTGHGTVVRCNDGAVVSTSVEADTPSAMLTTPAVMTEPATDITVSSATSLGDTAMNMPGTTMNMPGGPSTSLIVSSANNMTSGMENWFFQDESANLYSVATDENVSNSQSMEAVSLDNISEESSFEEGDLNLYDLPSIH